ncbi:hypothetical protein NX059_005019 [Plenodomus lindquistii]|nr:hypothetical protein NX059_005019 [Plenodomus lindquistii]
MQHLKFSACIVSSVPQETRCLTYILRLCSHFTTMLEIHEIKTYNNRSVCLAWSPFYTTIANIRNPNMASSTPSPFSLKETEDLDLHSTTTQNQILNTWLFTPPRSNRSPNTLSSLHHHTLARGHATLRQRLADLENLKLQLHHKYLNILMHNELSLEMIMDTGHSPYIYPDETIEGLSRGQLESLIKRDVVTLDRLVQVVEMWKGRIDRQLWGVWDD